MEQKKLSRRGFLSAVGAVGAVTFLAACQPMVPSGVAPAAPAAADQAATDVDYSNAKDVTQALKAEGAEVTMHSWGWSGLSTSVFVPKFAEMTEKQYGIGVKLNWDTSDIAAALRELPAAGKTIADAGLDVVDKEEESFDAAMALNWYEPINLPQYMPLLPNLADVEKPYIFRGPKENDADVYGAVYQGYEWLQALLNKKKVDVSAYKNWVDLANPELKDKLIDYPFNDSRGNFVFAGIVNNLIQNGTVQGELWSQDAWTAALHWWKDNNMDGQIHKWGDIGNDPAMRLMLQSSEAWGGCTWGSYTRELLATDWNKKDDLLSPFYPATGIIADRETLSAVRGAKHPVAGHILINWMLSTELNTAGWYKESKDAEAVNHWNVTESQFLVAYCGGCRQETRDLAPDWAKPYYPEDPGSLILTVDWPWYSQNSEWISKSYDSIVHGA